jgi:hypothetical protein
MHPFSFILLLSIYATLFWLLPTVAGVYRADRRALKRRKL